VREAADALFGDERELQDEERLLSAVGPVHRGVLRDRVGVGSERPEPEPGPCGGGVASAVEAPSASEHPSRTPDPHAPRPESAPAVVIPTRTVPVRFRSRVGPRGGLRAWAGASPDRATRSLADQLKRTASSVVLNLAEAAYNNGGHRRSRLESARGSANEARAALGLACAWGYIGEPRAAGVDALYDRVLAMTYRLWARA
jgi:four helix bundle protein